MKEKRRLDELLVQRGLARDVGHAQALILAGRVRGVSHPKAGLNVSADQTLEVEETPPFVSRGGLKLQAALKAFGLTVAGRLCVDIGASTGGFTDCLLQAGAAKVLAVDVGHGQLDWKLRNDPRVINREKTHVLTLTREDISAFFSARGSGSTLGAGLAAVDVSFISLEKVLPHLADILPGGTECVALVKPQFEVGPKDAPQGVVRDPDVHRRVLEDIERVAVASGFFMLSKRESPITGPEGNHEFLMHLRRV
ncbi:MAG: TlyA family RNA methyltransferase [Elusimicrobia bacterium]|nr:TlyA family RNA methyltransferase [Elusimicrobiota bacterium]